MLVKKDKKIAEQKFVSPLKSLSKHKVVLYEFDPFCKNFN